MAETHSSSNSLPSQQLQELKEIFSLVDADGGGTISKEELADLMRTLGLRATKLELDALVNEIDSRGTGEIDFDNFVTAMSRKVNINKTEDEILNAFAHFADEGGPVTTVTKHALVQALVLHGEMEKRMTADDAEDLVMSTIQAHSDTMGDRFDYVRFVKETMNK